MNVDLIPAELRERPQWLLWRYEERDGKPTKVPYQANLRRAKSTDPATWTTFERAVAAAERLGMDGIGFVFCPDDPYFGVDLDDELADVDRGAIALALNTYTELSIGGAGMHVIGRGRLDKGRHPVGLGIFDRDRYFVMTGEHVNGTPTTIEERQAELEEVLAEFLPTPAEEAVSNAYVAQPVDLPDQELLERMFGSRSGEKIRRLWAGDWSDYPSQSEADQALCNHLAFWTGNDPDRIDVLFRASDLFRPKWNREDYAQRTIVAAIGATSEVYRGRSGLSRGSDSVDSVGGSLGGVGQYGVTESALKDSVLRTHPPVVEAETESSSDSADSDSDSVRPFALPIREFVALEREHREPMLADADGKAVVGFLSLVLLGSLGGYGKTTWSIDLFLHMSAGVDYPPFTVPRPVSILLVENEGPEQLFADKLAARLEHFPHELKGRLDVCTVDWGGFSLADSVYRERLIGEIADKEYDLVFGDPLDSLGIQGVGSPEDTRRFLALMRQTGLNRTVAWWLNTHPRKEETKEALNEISGAWGGKPDSVFLLRMLEDDRTQIRQPKLRWARRGRGPTLLFAFDPETEAFSYIGEQAEEERNYLAEVRGLLADGEWRTVKEIAAPAAAGGIAANEKIVKKVLEEHLDVFESRTGDEAKALGRSKQATLWRLQPNEGSAA
jgi:putative DNA primase/helicase